MNECSKGFERPVNSWTFDDRKTCLERGTIKIRFESCLPRLLPTRGDPEQPGSSALRNPFPKSPCVGAQGGSWSNPPNWISNRGVQRKPVQKILRLTLLHSAVSYDSNAASSCSSPLRTGGEHSPSYIVLLRGWWSR